MNKYQIMTSILLSALTLSATPYVFAEEINISIPTGTSAPGCDETNECYIPSKVTVHPGDTVVWSNDDSAAHTVTSENTDDGFDSGIFMAGTSFSAKFDTLGEYNYFCMVHPWMKGSVLVTVGGMPEANLGAITIGNTAANSSTNDLMAEITSTSGKTAEEMMAEGVDVEYELSTLEGALNKESKHKLIVASLYILAADGHMDEDEVAMLEFIREGLKLSRREVEGIKKNFLAKRALS